MSLERQELQAESPGPDLATMSPARTVARKAVSMSLGDSLASSPVGQELGGRDHGEDEAAHGHDGDAPEAATTTAEDGFRGVASELPHRAALEKSFGVSFAGVKAYTDEHARRATGRLGAKAYASGNRIAFAMANPDQALVAHELTHVLQHTGHKLAKKSDGTSGEGGVEVSGEAEAERVEAQVASGKPAHGALEGDAGDGHAHGGHAAEAAHGHDGGHGHDGHGHDSGHGHEAAHRSEPAAHGAVASSGAKAQRPALSKTKFGTGMAFSPSRFEKEQSYTLWEADPPIEVPVGAVPGLNLLVEPSVKVKASAGVKFGKARLRAHLGVDGQVGVGFSYGSKIAEVYGESQATLNGGFTYERSKPKHHINDWDLSGKFTLGTQFAVGVKLGGGVVDARFEFGHCDIGTLFGLHWDNGKFDRSQIGWTWGAKPNEFFQALKALHDKVDRILKLPAKEVKKAWKTVSGAVTKLGGKIHKIHIPDVTPWKGLLPI